MPQSGADTLDWYLHDPNSSPKRPIAGTLPPLAGSFFFSKRRANRPAVRPEFPGNTSCIPNEKLLIYDTARTAPSGCKNKPAHPRLQFNVQPSPAEQEQQPVESNCTALDNMTERPEREAPRIMGVAIHLNREDTERNLAAPSANINDYTLAPQLGCKGLPTIVQRHAMRAEGEIDNREWMGDERWENFGANVLTASGVLVRLSAVDTIDVYHREWHHRQTSRHFLYRTLQSRPQDPRVHVVGRKQWHEGFANSSMLWSSENGYPTMYLLTQMVTEGGIIGIGGNPAWGKNRDHGLRGSITKTAASLLVHEVSSPETKQAVRQRKSLNLLKRYQQEHEACKVLRYYRILAEPPQGPTDGRMYLKDRLMEHVLSVPVLNYMLNHISTISSTGNQLLDMPGVTDGHHILAVNPHNRYQNLYQEMENPLDRIEILVEEAAGPTVPWPFIFSGQTGRPQYLCRESKITRIRSPGCSQFHYAAFPRGTFTSVMLERRFQRSRAVAPASRGDVTELYNNSAVNQYTINTAYVVPRAERFVGHPNPWQMLLDLEHHKPHEAFQKLEERRARRIQQTGAGNSNKINTSEAQATCKICGKGSICYNSGRKGVTLPHAVLKAKVSTLLGSNGGAPPKDPTHTEHTETPNTPIISVPIDIKHTLRGRHVFPSLEAGVCMGCRGIKQRHYHMVTEPNARRCGLQPDRESNQHFVLTQHFYPPGRTKVPMPKGLATSTRFTATSTKLVDSPRSHTPIGNSSSDVDWEVAGNSSSITYQRATSLKKRSAVQVSNKNPDQPRATTTKDIFLPRVEREYLVTLPGIPTPPRKGPAQSRSCQDLNWLNSSKQAHFAPPSVGLGIAGMCEIPAVVRITGPAICHFMDTSKTNIIGEASHPPRLGYDFMQANAPG